MYKHSRVYINNKYSYIMFNNGSKGILWEGPRAPLGSHGDPMGSNLGIPGVLKIFEIDYLKIDYILLL